MITFKLWRATDHYNDLHMKAGQNRSPLRGGLPSISDRCIRNITFSLVIRDQLEADFREYVT